MSSLLHERNFDNIGGLQEHIQTLREMIIYPLLYRELFDSYGIQAPRGVLFYGPPGTGKTLMAGAVAAECSRCCSRKVSFYVRKGGECLNKYVGESEKHLQNLFNQAHSTRPSIIFFDEIDGLVPTRSDMQEQVHASVVSTLLALMDGLDTKSEVFVIGATNRIDMIDPALRRPGRFDRELYFPLPPLESRLEIFKIHTSNWKNKPSNGLLLKLASECCGYCGADIQLLCSQAVMQSFNRSFPQVLDTTRRHHISLKNIYVRDEDFWDAKNKIVPASQRIYSMPSRPLNSEIEPLLKSALDRSIEEITKLCPFSFLYRNNMEFSKHKSLSCPRFLLIGKPGQAHITHIAPAILHFFDHLPVIVMDLMTINEDSSRTSDSSSLVHKVEEARQSMPSIIYLRNVTAWWNLIDDTAKQVLTSSLESLDVSSNSKIFIFGSATATFYDKLPPDIQVLFPAKKCFLISEPSTEERRNFFRQVLVDKNLQPPKSIESSDRSESDITGEVAGRRSSVLKRRRIDLSSKPDINAKVRLRQILSKNFDTIPVGRLRNGKAYRQIYDEVEVSPPKKARLHLIETPSYSRDEMDNTETGTGDIIIDVQKLEKLTETAVKVTAKARVLTLVRLYEELEIVSLRYSSKLDRSQLPGELEQEILKFTAT